MTFGHDSHGTEAMTSPRYGTKRKKKSSCKSVKKQAKRDTGRVWVVSQQKVVPVSCWLRKKNAVGETRLVSVSCHGRVCDTSRVCIVSWSCLRHQRAI